MTDLTANGTAPPLPAHGVSFAEAWRVWLRVAALSFGGPAGQIAVMHRIIVDEKKWVGERRFLHALSYCMLLPGPEAQQLATYIGWLMHRWPGAIVAGGLFVLPGVIAIMALSWVYALYGQVPIVAALFEKQRNDRARGARLCRDLFQPCAVPADRVRRRNHRLCRRPRRLGRVCRRRGARLVTRRRGR